MHKRFTILLSDSDEILVPSLYQYFSHISAQYGFIVEMILENPAIYIPAKWAECKETISLEQIKPFMTSRQLSMYNSCYTKKSISSSNKIVECLNCSYYETWSKTNKSHIFYWKNKSCLKGSWLVCLGTLKSPTDPKKLTEEEKKELSKHEDWEKYKENFDKIMDIIDRNNQRYCPYCGLGGRKNDAWTHITCYGCSKRYWYMWGESEDISEFSYWSKPKINKKSQSSFPSLLSVYLNLVNKQITYSIKTSA